MSGIGTIINAAAIFAGGLAGLAIGKHLHERFQSILMTTLGVAVIITGLAGCLKEMLQVTDNGIEIYGTYMMIASLVLGSLLGEAINLDLLLERFGRWLKIKTGNSRDPKFIVGFVTASLTVCVGAMGIIGALQDGISHDPSVLITKAILDAAIILVMTTEKGKGCVFSFIPVLIWQGLITICAGFLAPVLTAAAMCNLTLVGSILIALIGVNLGFGTRIKVANMLPAIIVAPACAFIAF